MSLPQLRAQLQAHTIPPPSQTWLEALISSRNPPPPMPSLVMTAKTRLLASDLTTPGLLDSAAHALPAKITAPAVRESRLAHDVYVQVLDIENLSRSRWDQVEELEAIERGEQTRGREVIRLPPNNNNNNNNSGDGSGAPVGTCLPEATARPQAEAAAVVNNATHRLVLQDCKGQRVFGLELVRMPEIAVGSLSIGAKILLKKGTVLARGSVLLQPTSVKVLGGRVEAWEKAWVAGRLASLEEAVARGPET